MLEIPDEDLREIAPYANEEIPAAMQRVLAHPAIGSIASEFFPGVPLELLREKAAKLKSTYDFQAQFIDPLLRGLEKRTTEGIKISGGEFRTRDGCYLFVCSHRDTILDPALFTDLLFRDGFQTPQICLGSNLLLDPLAVDLLKMNKGITVKRNLAPRDLMRWSLALSRWIRHTIFTGRDSVWIAQQEGRAKDGNDQTHPGILKMLALSGEGNFVQRLKTLNIVPVAISYEYDPSDAEKALELHRRAQSSTYRKSARDDLAAIVRAMRDPKGGIHIQIGDPLDQLWEWAVGIGSKSDQAKFIAAEIDKKIHMQFHNWPSNYIAHDLLSGTQAHGARYSQEKQQGFVERMEMRLDGLGLSREDRGPVKTRMLGMYAASVRRLKNGATLN